MKTNILKLIVLVFVTTLLFNGCGGDDSTTPSSSTTDIQTDPVVTGDPLESSLYGAWKYVDTAEDLEIFSTTRFNAYEQKSDDLLEVTEADGTVS